MELRSKYRMSLAPTHCDDPDPDGDVTLIIGSSKARMKVCSRIMSLASPALAALFSPKFKEGHQLSTAGNVVVPLPEDDPDVFRLICNILHFKDFCYEVELPLLLRLAITCDYYGITKPLEAWTEKWLDPHILATNPDDWKSAGELLWISFALGDAQNFTRTSQALMLYASSSEFEILKMSENTGYLPTKMLCE